MIAKPRCDFLVVALFLATWFPCSSRAASVLTLVCSETALAVITAGDVQINNALVLDGTQGLLPFEREIYLIDLNTKHATRKGPSGGEYSVSTTDVSISLTEIHTDTDIGARALVKVDRATGAYLRSDWSLDANGKPLATSFARIGNCVDADKPRL